VSFWRLTSQSMGFDTKHVSAVWTGTFTPRTITLDEQRFRARGLAQALRGEPGVAAVAVIDGHPLLTLESGLEINGKPFFDVRVKHVAGPFLEAMGMSLLRGRMYSEAEGFGDAPVAVVDTAAAALMWPEREPLGQIIKVINGPEATVVGVVSRMRTSLDPDADRQASVYVPLRRVVRGDLSFVVRSASVSQAELAAVATRVVRARDPDGFANAASLDPRVVFNRQTGEPALRTSVLLVFAVVALALVALGLYGLVTYTVEQRRREFGVRMALGARPAQVRWLVVKQALSPVLVGLAAGAAGASWATGFLKAWLFEVRPIEPSVFAAIGGLMIACALIASLRPAARAMRVDPVIALRAE